MYSGTYAIRHLSFLTSCDIRQNLWSLSISLTLFVKNLVYFKTSHICVSLADIYKMVNVILHKMYMDSHLIVL